MRLNQFTKCGQEKRLAILTYIANCRALGEIPPTVREIALAVRGSTSGTYTHLQILERMGHIRRVKPGIARGYVLAKHDSEINLDK